MAMLDGTPFEEFWRRAVRPGCPPVTWGTPIEKRPAGCVVWPRDTDDRKLYRDVTEDCKDGWRRAYEGVAPTPGEHALLRLAPWFEALLAEREEQVREGVELLLAQDPDWLSRGRAVAA